MRFEYINDQKFDQLKREDLQNIKGGKFWGRKIIAIEECDNGKTAEAYEQYVAGVCVKRGVTPDQMI